MENAALEKKVYIKDLFSCKSYIILVIANFISRFGDSLDFIAYGWMVYTLTGSKLLMGTIFAINSIPNIIFSPFAGTIVDRVKKKNIISLGYIGRASVVFLTAFMFMLGILKPWHLFIFTFLNSTFETFTAPAHSALIPLLLPKELFLTGNSFSSSAYKFAELIGTASAGIIIAVFKIHGAIFIDAITFLLASFLMFLIKVENDTKNNEQITINTYFLELKDGFLFINKQKLILTTLILFAIVNFCLAPLNIFMTVLAKDILKGGPEILSLIGIAFTMGSILGGLAVSQFGNRFKISTLIITSFIILGANYALLYLPGNVVYGKWSIIVTTAAFAFMGFIIPAASSPILSYIMSNTPKDLMGRVSSISNMTSCCATPVGSAIAGVLSEYISVSIQFLIMGIIIICVSISISFYKDFRNV